MNQETIAGIRLFYDPAERDAAELVSDALRQGERLLRERWGLAAPEDCRAYVMTSWLRFLLQSAPWPWKALVALTLPLTARRAKATWPYAGGWSLSYGKRRVVGIKPPRLIQSGNRSLGEQIYIPGRSLNETVQTVTCHELAHAFTAHLKLPTWLHEGLATLAMERCLGRPLIRRETLLSLEKSPSKGTGRGVERLPLEDQEAVIALYARGYWLARFIDETRPDLMCSLLAARRTRDSLEEMVTAAYAKNSRPFWQDINHQVVAFYSSEENSGG